MSKQHQIRKPDQGMNPNRLEDIRTYIAEGLNLRVADADLVRLDRLVAILSKRVDGIPITRSSVIIGSVARWLEQLEKEQP